MASLVYTKMLNSLVRGNLNFSQSFVESPAAGFKVMLVTASYTPDKGNHEFRSSVTSGETTGTGYTAGGVGVGITLTNNTSEHRQDIAFGQISWSNATITARAAVIYQHTGSAATDRLVAYVDFSQNVSSTNAAFAVSFSSPLRLQN